MKFIYTFRMAFPYFEICTTPCETPHIGMTFCATFIHQKGMETYILLLRRKGKDLPRQKFIHLSLGHSQFILSLEFIHLNLCAEFTEKLQTFSFFFFFFFFFFFIINDD